MSPRVRVTIEYLGSLVEGVAITPTVIEMETLEISQTRQVTRRARPDGTVGELVPSDKVSWTIKGKGSA